MILSQHYVGTGGKIYLYLLHDDKPTGGGTEEDLIFSPKVKKDDLS